jgi:cation diffusion facilitator CzcD-associated flavoprotein CzcO
VCAFVRASIITPAGKSFLILEKREAMGGTWDLFRYPGVRSDSDMYTLGYAFKPWKDGVAIAPGASILEYIKETAAEHNIEERIRYSTGVERASWSSQGGRWTLETPQGVFTCRVMYMCSGYYDYDSGYTPPFPGLEQFAGEVVHPQQWTGAVDYVDKKVAIADRRPRLRLRVFLLCAPVV